MLETLFNLFFSPHDPEVFNFRIGYAYGVIIALILLALAKLLLIFFKRYPRKGTGIEIRGDQGALFITPRAISDLVNSLQPDFDSIRMTKVTLMETKQAFYLQVNAVYDLDGRSVPEIKNEVEQAIIDILKERFGIDCIEKVNVKLDYAENGKRNSRL